LPYNLIPFLLGPFLHLFNLSFLSYHLLFRLHVLPSVTSIRGTSVTSWLLPSVVLVSFHYIKTTFLQI
jgi:hypothetical protein